MKGTSKSVRKRRVSVLKVFNRMEEIVAGRCLFFRALGFRLQLGHGDGGRGQPDGGPIALLEGRDRSGGSAGRPPRAPCRRPRWRRAASRAGPRPRAPCRTRSEPGARAGDGRCRRRERRFRGRIGRKWSWTTTPPCESSGTRRGVRRRDRRCGSGSRRCAASGSCRRCGSPFRRGSAPAPPRRTRRCRVDRPSASALRRTQATTLGRQAAAAPNRSSGSARSDPRARAAGR